MSGVLSVQVSALPIVAGSRAIVALQIANPFHEEVVIKSIDAPSSRPLLPAWETTAFKSLSSKFKSLPSKLKSVRAFDTELRVGPLIARFPTRGRVINVDLKPTSKLTLKSPFAPQDNVNITVQEGAEFVYDIPEAERQSSRKSR